MFLAADAVNGLQLTEKFRQNLVFDFNGRGLFAVWADYMSPFQCSKIILCTG